MNIGVDGTAGQRRQGDDLGEFQELFIAIHVVTLLKMASTDGATPLWPIFRSDRYLLLPHNSQAVLVLSGFSLIHFDPRRIADFDEARHSLWFDLHPIGRNHADDSVKIIVYISNIKFDI